MFVPEITHHCPKVPFFLVGTKADCRDDQEIAAKLGNLTLNMNEECTSKTNVYYQIATKRKWSQIQRQLLWPVR